MNTLREINLELGMPYAADAVRRMTFEIHHSKSMHCTVLKIIHGYGLLRKRGKNTAGSPGTLGISPAQTRNPRLYPWGEILNL